MSISSMFFRKKNKELDMRRKDESMVARVIRRQESITRKDIASWRDARLEAERVNSPRQSLLQELYRYIMTDGLLSSHVDMRIDKSQGADFSLVDGKGNIDEDATALMRDMGWYDTLTEMILESRFYGSSLIELGFDASGKLTIDLVPRKHVEPSAGLFYPDTALSDGIAYRTRADYGSFILEFYPKKDDLGLLNKVVPYCLMKNFALSCWSELCEIYGIPPRVLKTDTRDEETLARAEQMMNEIGSAAWFIIDTEESFEFAQGSSTNGDVYKQLIAICDEQISIRILGATLGMDTLNGNRSKEETSTKLFENITEADKRYLSACYNTVVIPALTKLGLLRSGLRISIAKATDTDTLWERTRDAAPYYDFDTDWLNETFGLRVTGQRNMLPSQELSMRDDDRYRFFL